MSGFKAKILGASGIPFQSLQPYNYIFWIAGFVLVFFSVGWLFYGKVKKNN